MPPGTIVHPRRIETARSTTLTRAIKIDGHASLSQCAAMAKPAGPPCLEEHESTFVVGPECTVTVDDYFNLIADIVFDRPIPTGDKQ
jgi:hypothetical protein